MIDAIEDKIVVEYLKASKTKGGLILPEGAQEPQGYGKVLSVGEDVNDKIKVDQILVFHARAGMDMIIDDTVQKCLKSEEVYGILEDDELKELLEPLTLKAKPEDNIIKPSGIIT